MFYFLTWVVGTWMFTLLLVCKLQYTFIHSIYFTIKQILKKLFYLQLPIREKLTERRLLRSSPHVPVLPHKVCISPAAAALCGSSESPTPVLGLPTTLHTLQTLPPYLWENGFSTLGLGIGS